MRCQSSLSLPGRCNFFASSNYKSRGIIRNAQQSNSIDNISYSQSHDDQKSDHVFYSRQGSGGNTTPELGCLKDDMKAVLPIQSTGRHLSERTIRSELHGRNEWNNTYGHSAESWHHSNLNDQSSIITDIEEKARPDTAAVAPPSRAWRLGRCEEDLVINTPARSALDSQNDRTESNPQNDHNIASNHESIGEELNMMQPAKMTDPSEELPTTPRGKKDTTSHVYTFSMSQHTAIHMTQTMRKLRELGLPDQVNLSEHLGLRPLQTRYRPKPNDVLERLSKNFQKSNRGRTFNQEYARLFRKRKALPIQQRHVVRRLRRIIEDNDVVVLVSDTGSGKTTQLPQLILDWKTSEGVGAFCNVLCTQPRRLAATTVAQHVAKEQGTFIGGHVGWSVRFSHRLPKYPGSISYWTAGVLLKLLYDDPEMILQGYSHLIIDEVHERSLTTDLVLTKLRDMIRSRKQAGLSFPKVILMSATIVALDFERYLGEPFGAYTPKVASLEVPGRTYKVDVHMLDEIMHDIGRHSSNARFVALLASNKSYLENEDAFEEERALDHAPTTTADVELQQEEIPLGLTAAIIAHVVKSSDFGDVLVFLPGIAEIEKVKLLLLHQPVLGLDFNDPDQFCIFRLHAALYETNERVFEPVPPGCRRVILSTTIAQTSITLPEVVHVIDPGKQRQLIYHPVSQTSEFTREWCDQSSAKQRRGRVGRTRPGHYWALFTQARYNSLSPKPRPEILSTEIMLPCLTLKSQLKSGSLTDVLSRCLDAPAPISIQSAIKALKELRMLTPSEEITPLGRFAAWFPLPPATSRALLLGAIFRCLRPLLIMASHNPEKPLVYSTKSIKEQMLSSFTFAGVGDDDRNTQISAFEQYHDAIQGGLHETISDLEDRNVKQNAYQEMINVAQQICDLLATYGLLEKASDNAADPLQRLPSHLNTNMKSNALIKSLALSMQHAKLGVWNEEETSIYSRDSVVALRPFSVNARAFLKMLGRDHYARTDGELFSYSLLLSIPEEKKPLMMESSNISPLAAMLFGGSIEIVDERVIQIDGWLKYKIEMEVDGCDVGLDNPVDLILEFRKTVDRFVQLCCAKLHNEYQTQHPHQHGPHQRIGSWLATDNPLVTVFAQGLKDVVESDAFHWDEVLNLSQKAVDEPRWDKLDK